MKTAFKLWEANRKQYLNYLDNSSLTELNKIPKGYSNNLIWNIGHIIVVQQALVYNYSGLNGNITEDMFNLYKPGTKPTGIVQQQEVNTMKGLLTSLIEKTIEDYNNNLFNSFEARKTITGFNLNTVNDAIAFNNFHEALHLGYMLGIKKFVQA